jgi:hypothetical protein
MRRLFSALTAVTLISGAALAACSSTEIPAGQDNGLTTGDGGADAGNCCQTGFDLYACTYSDGGAGFACHNPAQGCASSTTCGEGCDPVVSGACGGSTGDSGTSDLQWYTTCGYPVCNVGDGGSASADAGPACAPVGSSCTDKGQTCGTPSDANCGAILVCDDHDPRASGMCPISTKKYKDGIQYVDDAELTRLHDETLHMKLATYNYKSVVADPDPKHLGFIIEDNPSSLAVDKMHNRVDMYGYLSMIVASMQVQEKEIADLRSELRASQRDAAACRSPKTK